MKIGFNGYNAVYNGHFATYGQTPPQPIQNGWYGRTFRSWQDVCTYINVDRPYGIEIPISYTLHTTQAGQSYIILADNLNVGSAQIFDENVAFFVGPYNLQTPHFHDGQMYTMYFGKIPIIEDLSNNGLVATATPTVYVSDIWTKYGISSYSSFKPQEKNIQVDIQNNWQNSFMSATDISANMVEYYPYTQYEPSTTCDYTSARFGNISANYEGTIIYGEPNGYPQIHIATNDGHFATQCNNKTISSTIRVANIVGESLQPQEIHPFNAIFNASVYPSAQGDTAVFPIV